MMFVTNKYDEKKNALRSTLANDATTNIWVHLPNTTWENDECHGFPRDAFRVLNGFPMMMQA